MNNKQHIIVDRVTSFLHNSNIIFNKNITDDYIEFINDDISIKIDIEADVIIQFITSEYEYKCKYMEFALKVFDNFIVFQ